jgi:hypothetical protein
LTSGQSWWSDVFLSSSPKLSVKVQQRNKPAEPPTSQGRGTWQQGETSCNLGGRKLMRNGQQWCRSSRVHLVPPWRGGPLLHMGLHRSPPKTQKTGRWRLPPLGKQKVSQRNDHKEDHKGKPPMLLKRRPCYNYCHLFVLQCLR